MNRRDKFALKSCLLDWLHSFQNTSRNESIARKTRHLVFDSAHMTWATYRPVDANVLEPKQFLLIFVVRLLLTPELGLAVSYSCFLRSVVTLDSQHFLVFVVVEVSGKVDVEYGQWPVAIHRCDVPLWFFPVRFAHGHFVSVFVGFVVLRNETHKLLVFLGKRELVGADKSDAHQRGDEVHLLNLSNYIMHVK